MVVKNITPTRYMVNALMERLKSGLRIGININSKDNSYSNLRKLVKYALYLDSKGE